MNNTEKAQAKTARIMAIQKAHGCTLADAKSLYADEIADNATEAAPVAAPVAQTGTATAKPEKVKQVPIAFEKLPDTIDAGELGTLVKRRFSSGSYGYASGALSLHGGQFVGVCLTVKNSKP